VKDLHRPGVERGDADADDPPLARPRRRDARDERLVEAARLGAPDPTEGENR